MSRWLVAMSGGVDSSVAAALLVREGHEVVGLTMDLGEGMSRDFEGAVEAAATGGQTGEARSRIFETFGGLGSSRTSC